LRNFRILIYNLLKKIKLYSQRNLITLWYKLLFFLHPAVEMRQSAFISGWLKLKIDPDSKVLISDQVRIHSGHKHNPFYGERKTLLNINKGAALVIGKNVGISNSSIYCLEKIEIEADVMIGGGCQIYDSNFHPVKYEDRIWPSGKTISTAILIKEGAFIGGGSHICKGVTIGQHAVVASGSVVRSSIPDYEVWGGNPATFIKKLKRNF